MYKIWFSHGGECDDCRLLGCDAIKKVSYGPPLPIGCLAVMFFPPLCVIYHVIPRDWYSNLVVDQAVSFETSAKLYGVASQNSVIFRQYVFNVYVM